MYVISEAFYAFYFLVGAFISPKTSTPLHVLYEEVKHICAYAVGSQNDVIRHVTSYVHSYAANRRLTIK